MSTQIEPSDTQGKVPAEQNRNWQKPVLDILELQSANHLPPLPANDRHENRGSY
jgi:hypothetical protein